MNNEFMSSQDILNIQTSQQCIDELAKYTRYPHLTTDEQKLNVTALCRRYAYLEWDMQKEPDIYIQNQQEAKGNRRVGGSALPPSQRTDNNTRSPNENIVTIRGDISNYNTAEYIHLTLHEIRHVKQYEVQQQTTELSPEDAKLKETLERDYQRDENGEFILDKNNEPLDKVQIENIPTDETYKGTKVFDLAWGTHEREKDADNAANEALQKIQTATKETTSPNPVRHITKKLFNYNASQQIKEKNEAHEKSDLHYSEWAQKQAMELSGKPQPKREQTDSVNEKMDYIQNLDKRIVESENSLRIRAAIKYPAKEYKHSSPTQHTKPERNVGMER